MDAKQNKSYSKQNKIKLVSHVLFCTWNLGKKEVKKKKEKPCLVVYAFNTSTWETGAEGGNL